MNTRTPPPTRSPAITLAASLAALIVIAAIALLTNHDDHHGSANSTTPPVSATITSTSAASSTTPPRFGIPTTDLWGARLESPPDPAGVLLPQDTARPDPALGAAWLIAAPGGIMWQRGWGGAALPFSRSDGPTTVAGGIASGFAHTPQGAGLAAADAMARALAAPDGVWQQVIATRFLGDQAALIARYARSRADTADAAKYVVVPAGFKVVDYRDDFTVVQIGLRTPQGQAAYSSWPMAWADDDWRVRIPDDPDALWAPSTPVSSLADFGVWR
jgi:hypothetical protein